MSSSCCKYIYNLQPCTVLFFSIVMMIFGFCSLRKERHGTQDGTNLPFFFFFCASIFGCMWVSEIVMIKMKERGQSW